MALVSEKMLRKTLSIERRPLMLKDYLIDDLSSSSSNGFKSFPRRQCCSTTIRFLLEVDLKTRDSNTTTTKRLLHRSRSKAASTTFSALQRASEAVLSAVKQLPFPSLRSPSPSPSVQRKAKRALLPRSFSRKLLKRRFWRKADRHDKEEHAQTIKPLKLFGEFLGEQHQPSDHKNLQLPTTSSTPSNRVSIGCSSRKSNSNSWTESDFTDNSTSRSSHSNSESSSQNDTVESREHLQSSSVSNRVGVSVGEDSVNCSESEENTKDWGNEEEKEQCSPVSVLDCPFEDDEADVTSPFHQPLAGMEGRKHKLVQKLRRFESLAILEPVDLEKRIALSELEDDETKKKTEGLVKKIKSTAPSNNVLLSKSGNLLSDFFRENLNSISDTDTLKAAQDWISGKTEKAFVGWEIEGEMVTNVRWRNVDEEKQELGLGLESELFTSLVDEFVTDLFEASTSSSSSS